ncbi:MAG: 16S rRNA (cytosine(1402)-N(4))-methyltransferase [Ilumatobacteraceae bacterium]
MPAAAAGACNHPPSGRSRRSDRGEPGTRDPPRRLEQAIATTTTGGRIAVLSYHSGEDRIVKRVFRHAATGGCTCPSGLPCVCGAVRTVRIVRPEHREPGAAERAANPRSESARLRVVERIEPVENEGVR